MLLFLNKTQTNLNKEDQLPDFLSWKAERSSTDFLHPTQTNGASAPGHPPSLLDPLSHQTAIITAL